MLKIEKKSSIEEKKIDKKLDLLHSQFEIVLNDLKNKGNEINLLESQYLDESLSIVGISPKPFQDRTNLKNRKRNTNRNEEKKMKLQNLYEDLENFENNNNFSKLFNKVQIKQKNIVKLEKDLKEVNLKLKNEKGKVLREKQKKLKNIEKKKKQIFFEDKLFIFQKENIELGSLLKSLIKISSKYEKLFKSEKVDVLIKDFKDYYNNENNQNFFNLQQLKLIRNTDDIINYQKNEIHRLEKK